MILKSIDPSTGQVLQKFNEWNGKKVDERIRKCNQSFNIWKEIDISERNVILKKISHILRKNKREYARLITIEMGKPITQSESEIDKCAWVCDYYAENGKKFLEDEYIKMNHNYSYVRYTPLGVILAVMPWNFPFWQVFRSVVPILMAGNGIILKHSSNVPQCALAIEEIFKNSGVPSYLFQTLLVSSNAITRVISNNLVAAVTVTGGITAGRHIAGLAGTNLKKVVLELGGNDPFIVLEDADIHYTIEHAVKARMINSGQSCIAAKRFIIHKNVYEEFIDGFCEKIQALSMGNPLDRETDVGPLARKDIVQKVDAQVKSSVHNGAQILVGGKRLSKTPGYYYYPTVVSNIRPHMPLYYEETFGPVAAVIKVRNTQEAIEKANDSSYGLGSSIWTGNISNGEMLTKQIQAGSVFVNEYVQSDPRLPFGGVKQSGFGRELSHFGIKEFVNIQTVYIKNKG